MYNSLCTTCDVASCLEYVIQCMNKLKYEVFQFDSGCLFAALNEKNTAFTFLNTK